MGNCVTRSVCPFFLQSIHFQSRGKSICARLWRYVWNSYSGQNIVNVSCLQLSQLVRKTAPRETENNDYAKFGSDKQKALWYVMVFSGVVNCILCSKYINLQTGQPICTASLPYTKNPISIHLSPFSPSFLKAAPALYIVAEQGKGSDSPYF